MPWEMPALFYASLEKNDFSKGRIGLSLERIRLSNHGLPITMFFSFLRNVDLYRYDRYVDGCFDIMHSGHYNAIRQAKRLCDVLVVGVRRRLSKTLRCSRSVVHSVITESVVFSHVSQKRPSYFVDSCYFCSSC